MPDLKNCPHCNGAAEYALGDEGPVICVECNATAYEAEGWNRRAQPEVDDLASLVRQLARALKKHSPDSNLAERAVGYLQRKDLQGSPYREKR